MNTPSALCLFLAGVFLAGDHCVINAQNQHAVFTMKKESFSNNIVKNNNIIPGKKTGFFKLILKVVNDDNYCVDDIAALVKIYHNDLLIAVFNSGLQDEMQVDFEKGKLYTVQILKPGFITKSLLVSTVIPRNVSIGDNETYTHETSVLLIKRTANSDSDKITLVGMICYCEEQDNFVGVSLVPDLINQKEVIANLKVQGYIEKK